MMKAYLSYLALLFLAQSLSAVTFKIDYTYDLADESIEGSIPFFGDPNNPNDGRKERRDAIEAVAAFFSELINDEFLVIDASEFSQAEWTPQFRNPSTGEIISLPTTTVIPANEVVIYVGSMDLQGNILGSAGPAGFRARGFNPWFERLRGRGQIGALATPATDTAVWGGQISFDSPRSWNFSLSQNEPGFEFIAVAIHEFCHILGIGTSNSWNNLIESNSSFSGVNSNRSLGNLTVDSDGGHFSIGIPSSVSFQSFNVTHGTSQPALMRASISDDGSSFNVVTDLDLAALIDIGWQIQVPTTIDTFTVQSGNPILTWLSSSFLEYQIMRSTDLEIYTQQGSNITGNGTIQSWTDPTMPLNKAFYRIRSIPASQQTQAAGSSAITSNLVSPSPLNVSRDYYREESHPPAPPIICGGDNVHACETCDKNHQEK